ncbi:MAG: threonine-phosphate decarboxylase CobD, partial [Gammaproteobacteria bacterium]
MTASAAPFQIFRVHGGKVEAARALFPESRLPWIDLSTGIGPWAYPFAPLPAEAFTRLPEPESLAALEAAAAESFGVSDARRVVATPGSDLALRMLGRRFADRKVAVVRPGYSGHMLAWETTPVTAIAADDLEAAARHHDVILLANPNNPDGRVIGRQRLLDIAAVLASRSGVLVVDEAFADASPANSLSNTHANGLILFRSFGKFFGLAGVRLGFVIAAEDEARAFRQALGDWPVSGPAVSIGTAAYRDLAWQEMQRQRLLATAARLDNLLIGGGLAISGGTVLFRLVRCSDADAVFRHLAGHSILTRPFNSDPGLLRVGLPGDEAHWPRLAAALDSRRRS